jgi:hypothetical protein
MSILLRSFVVEKLDRDEFDETCQFVYDNVTSILGDWFPNANQEQRSGILYGLLCAAACAAIADLRLIGVPVEDDTSETELSAADVMNDAIVGFMTQKFAGVIHRGVVDPDGNVRSENDGRSFSQN